MRVVYRSIIKEIEKAVDAADKAERTIEVIRLTPKEWTEYMMETTSPCPPSCNLFTTKESWYQGRVKIVQG